MTKLITVFLIILAVFVGYRVYVYYEKVADEQDIRELEEARRRNVDPNGLTGLPWDLTQSYNQVKDDPAALRRWLKANQERIKDPRLSWIQLDFVELIGRDSPNEAREIFNSVKPRIATNSPVYPRVQKLEKTFR